MKRLIVILLLVLAGSLLGEEQARLKAEALPDLPDKIGMAGPFVGVHNDALIVAGGANFPVPEGEDLWEVPKVYHADAWVLEKKGGGYEWKTGFKLKQPVGYGMCVSTKQGVVCVGGQTGEIVYKGAFRLEWKNGELKQVELPPLPEAITGGAAALIGEVMYVAGGQTAMRLDTATKKIWRMDLSAEKLEWEALPAWPGPERAFNQMVAQHNGREVCLYLFGGRRQNPEVEGIEGIVPMSDVYEFSPKRYETNKAEAWRKRAASPKPIMAGTAAPIGQSHFFVVGHADGNGLKKIAADPEFEKNHTGFPKRAWAYHTITDTWIDAGPLPANHVTTPAVKWGDDIIVASGEIKPRVRSTKVWKLTPVADKKPFGAINFTVLTLYLLAMVAVGVWFMRKNKTTDDYFRGGQNIPWWAAACSIYATMLSSLTYISLPAKIYATDWLLYVSILMIPAVAPLAIYGAMPFFRRIDATSAYEYLGKRFNRPIRLFGSGLFTLFHISRMGIVMALTALALSSITPLTEWQSVLIMGVLCLIYCTMGGIEAVVWTDTIQTVVLLGGAAVCVFFLLDGVAGGFGGLMDIAQADEKMKMVNLDFSADSYTVTALWVVVLGGLAQNLSSYTADQAVVQRYMTTKDTSSAARSIWANGIMAALGALLFFFIGTGLYGFYHSHPELLNPAIKTDQVFPAFIAAELPVGIAGLIVAGIFAAAQSTVSTSMNSTATTLVTDFLRPFNRCADEEGYLQAAKKLTLVMGVLGTLAGLVFIDGGIRSLMDEYFKVIGMFLGALSALFLLGIVTTRAHAQGAIIGLLGGVTAMVLIWLTTDTAAVLYPFIGVTSCLLIGYVASAVLPAKANDLENLTLHTLAPKESAHD